jgi:hypothetical protein
LKLGLKLKLGKQRIRWAAGHETEREGKGREGKGSKGKEMK